ncbi:hypothetical protein QJQ45_002365 [Haematococcus lacustris]|nr:hypothetical protein QJQ45_002365 [Haematococcus lacustris]
MSGPSSESYSLWLMPSGESGAKLAAEVKRLAEQHSAVQAPCFPPHVTLLGDIQQPRDSVLDISQRLAQQLKKYRLNFLNVSTGTFYYQCVFLLVAQEPAVMQAAAAAREAFGMSTGPYMPHLSLLYADLSDADKAKAADSARTRLFGEGQTYDTLLVDPGFTADRLALWSTPTDDKSTASWCLVAEFPLGT